MNSVAFKIDPIDIKLLVALSTSIMELDLSTRTAKVFFDKATPDVGVAGYFGITWDHQYIYVIGSTPESVYYPKKNTRSRLLVLNKNGELQGEIEQDPLHPIENVHQLQHYKNKIYVVSTKHNVIRIYDKETKTWSTFAPSPKWQGEDYHHFNSIWFDSDGSFYVCAHNHSHSESIRTSEIFQFDAKFSLLRILEVGENNHNIFPLRGTLATCSSRHNVVQLLNGETILEVYPFPRGVVSTDDYLLIAKSSSNREGTVSGIDIFSTNTLELVGTVEIKAPQVFEIRCLNQLDKAHNQEAFL